MKPSQPPPLDQRIVDDFFQVASLKNGRKISWLYGMIATYGLRPEELKKFTWNKDNTINVKHKKKAVRPLHPQWVVLFGLKEKQPSNTEGCWEDLCFLLYKTMASGKTSYNVTDLLLSHELRKKFYLRYQAKQKATPELVSAGAS
jgi:hypothetical protein